MYSIVRLHIMSKHTSVPNSVLQYITDASRVIDSSEALLKLFSDKIKIYLKSEFGPHCWAELECNLDKYIELNENISICFKTKNMKKLVRVIEDSNSSLEISVDKKENILQLALGSIQFRTLGIDIATTSLLTKSSLMNEAGEVVVQGSALDLPFKAFSLINGFATLKIDPNNWSFIVIANGTSDSMRYKCDQSMIEKMKFKNNNTIKKTLIGDYFGNMQLKIPDQVNVLMSVNHKGPLKISHPIPNVEASIDYHLPVKY